MAKEKRLTSQFDNTSKLDKFVLALEQLRQQNTLILQEVVSRLVGDFANDDTLTHNKKAMTLLQIRSDISRHLVEFLWKAPTKAPSMWAGRDKLKNETPVEFVQRVYIDSLGRGLTQSDIRRLDFDLYRALQNWKRRHGWPSSFPLPTKQKKNDMLLAKYASNPLDSPSAALAALNPEARLFEAARNRVRKKRS